MVSKYFCKICNSSLDRCFKLSSRGISTAPCRFKIRTSFDLPKRYRGSKDSIWNVYGQLALDYKPINFGQGFPDFPPPKYITDALASVANGDSMLHQYTRGYGHPRLVKAVAKLYSSLICREINPNTEVLITIGAYEALFCCIMGHTDVGDEVIIIEPSYDCYEPIVKYAGGIPKFIPLKLKEPKGRMATSNDWVMDKKKMECLFNEKTKILILNNPSNPVGKVFNKEELTFMADLCKKYNTLCISDEVYEWMVYKPHKLIRTATLPGMWERTMTIGSAGKSFNVTGWKTGWIYCPSKLMKNLQLVHQNTVYTCVTPIQEALAVGFETECKRFGSDECFFMSLTKDLERKRNIMAKFLKDVGMKPTVPDGGYFMLADWTPLASKIDLSKEKDPEKDFKFTKWMTKNVGFQGIPPSAFYGEAHKKLGENFVRYCFIKKDENLKKAAAHLKKWKESGKK